MFYDTLIVLAPIPCIRRIHHATLYSCKVAGAKLKFQAHMGTLFTSVSSKSRQAVRIRVTGCPSETPPIYDGPVTRSNKSLRDLLALYSDASA